MTVQNNSAMGENNKMKILANDMVRRLLNTGEDMGKVEKSRVVDLYAQKLLNSGYQHEQVRRILYNGIKGYEKSVKKQKMRTEEFTELQ